MSAEFIDFRELRKQLSIAEVLNHYQVELKVRGTRATGLCPLPSHPQRDRGSRTASFSVDLDRGLFNCFGCKAGGSVLDLAIRLEGKNPDNPADVRSVALMLVRTFNLDTSGNGRRDIPNTARLSQTRHVTSNRQQSEPAEEPSRPDAIVNAPLDFVLKVDPAHPYLASRGFTQETIDHFELGFCSRGLLKDRVAIPLHDEKGQLVGYAGRTVDDRLVDDHHPKYLFPGSRERDGKHYEFHKSELLYNFHRVGRVVNDLIVVEGFASTWWLHQHGFPDVVATMGSSCSSKQRQLILDLLDDHGRLWILTDEDDAGNDLADDLLHHMASRRWCKWVRLEPTMQPTDLAGEELAGYLATA